MTLLLIPLVVKIWMLAAIVLGGIMCLMINKGQPDQNNIRNILKSK